MATNSSRLVVIAGGSGFLGRGLARCLLERGYQTTILSRSASPPADFPTGVNWACWDAESLGEWSACLDGAAAVVNFVGRSVDCRKTEEHKRIILESRVKSCQVLGQAMNNLRRPPPIWIQSATAHIVGDPEPKDAICDEATPPGPMDEMAPRVGVAWERAFAEAKLDNQRGVILRISFVLGPHGGAMIRLKKLTKLGLGGTVGSGDQWLSWIHQDDLNRLIVCAIEDDAYSGVYMVTAPEPVTNRQFMRAMRRAYRRPWSPPAPAIGVRLACRFILNTDPELALLGRRCLPNRLLNEHHFQFHYPTLDPALENLRQQESSL
jgi:uncharacterized protein (TIGR01777 family)